MVALLPSLPLPNARPPVAGFLLRYFRHYFPGTLHGSAERWWKDLRRNSAATYPFFMAYSYHAGTVVCSRLDADLIQTILSASQRDPVRFPKNYLFIEEIIGDGLVSLEGSAWSRHRRIIQPSFQTNFLKEALDRSVPKHCASLISAWKATQGTTIDAFTHLSSVTLDVIGEVAFSHDFAACQTLDVCGQSKPLAETLLNTRRRPADPLLQSFNASLKISALTVVLSLMNLSWLDKYLNRKAPIRRSFSTKPSTISSEKRVPRTRMMVRMA